MYDVLRDLALFVEVAKHTSFTRAAENMQMSVSTLSKRIAAMEKTMKTPLFHRNTRTVSLTESGMLLYERSVPIISDAENAFECVMQQMSSPAGILRVSMLSDIYHAFLSKAVVEFAHTWPDIHLHVSLSDRPVDLLKEPFDIDIQVGALPDSRLIARKIYTIRPVLYAAPSLLSRYPTPKHPEDIQNMPCIHLMRQSNVWTLHKGRQTQHVNIHPVHLVNSISMWHDFALAGLGLAFLHAPLVREFEESRTLVRILPEWSGATHDMSIIMANKQVPQRVRLFVDFLTDFFRSTTL